MLGMERASSLGRKSNFPYSLYGKYCACTMPWLPTSARDEEWVGRSVMSVTLSACLCPRSKRKRLQLPPTPKLTDIILSACIDPEVKRSKVKVTELSRALWYGFAGRYDCIFYPRHVMLARVLAIGLCQCLCVCLSHDGIIFKRLHGSIWFLRTTEGEEGRH